jgi:hypothetical protein
MAATPTRNTTVPAANRKPKNRTSKRIIEYPFQPERRNYRRLPHCEPWHGTIEHSTRTHNILATRRF